MAEQTTRPSPLDGLAEAIAAAPVWCPCYDSPEPSVPWVAPDDEHADTHVLDWMQQKGSSS